MILRENKFYNAALFYAGLGWKVFPLRAGLKEPATSHGVHDASSDLTQIQKWWTNHPNANVAIACGPASGIYVLDVDVNVAKDFSGFESLVEFKALPQTVSATTPRGGKHYFFVGDPQKLPAGKIGFRKGLDIKAKGGYVVAAPSVCTEGAGAGGRYQWVDGFHPGAVDLATWPADMHPVVQSPWAKPPVASPQPPVRTPTATTSASGGADATQRASKYLETVEAAVQGDSGHNALMWAYRVLITGFMLPRAEVMQLMWGEYNPRCDPPWMSNDKADFADFERKYDEVLKQPSKHPDGWLLNEGGPDNEMQAVCDNLLRNHYAKEAGQKAKAVRAEEKQDLTELDYLCKPTGTLGMLTGWMNRQALRDQPLLSLGCALAFYGTLFGRKIMESRRGGRTNIYCIGVARTSAGKDNAPDCVRRLCHEVGDNDMISGINVTSGSAIETMLADTPSAMLMFDEIGHLLKDVKSGKSEHKGDIVTLLMQVYSRASTSLKGREFADKEKQVRIYEPCLCMWGTSTPGRFQDGISPSELADGWLSRCLVFSSDTRPPKNRSTQMEDPPLELTEFVQGWLDYNNRPVVEMEGKDPRPFAKKAEQGDVFEKVKFVTTEAAEEVFFDFDKECDVLGNENDHVGPLWFKCEENARRIALIVAACNYTGDPIISEEHAGYSCKLVRFLTRSFIRNFAGNMTEGVVDKKRMAVLGHIKKAGKLGILNRDLAKKVKNLTGRERGNIIDDLVESGEVLKLMQGRTSRFWHEDHGQGYVEAKNAK